MSEPDARPTRGRTTETPAAADGGLDPAFGPAVPLPALAPGTRIDIVKRDPDGRDVVTYPGLVLPNPDQPGWLLAEAWWVNPSVDLGGLTFHTGDRLVEFFSSGHPWNAFAVYDPASGALRGWYANVTRPARVEPGPERPMLIWQDLYLDVVATPGGYLSVRDEDELADSGLAGRDPALHAAVVRALEAVRTGVMTRSFPFGPIRS